MPILSAEKYDQARIKIAQQRGILCPEEARREISDDMIRSFGLVLLELHRHDSRAIVAP